MLLFTDFQFDPSQNILYKNNEIITLTANQAKLLALFLADPKQILSKEDILQHVWCDRVVSEQVVFQNISQLRAIFSDGAIKTFPKRGYQWQLVIQEQVHNTSASAAVIESDSDKLSKKTSFYLAKKWQIWVLALSFIVIFVAYFAYFQGQTSSSKSSLHEPETGPKVILLPFTTRFNSDLTTLITEHNKALTQQFNASSENTNELIAKEDVWSFINSPYMVRKKLVSNDDELVLSGLVFKMNDPKAESKTAQYLLEYLLQGKHRKWRGYLMANSVAELSKQLIQQVRLVSHSQYFTLAVDAFTTAELSLMHSQQTNNLDVLKHLIERLLHEDNLDVASARIEQMLTLSKTQQHSIYTAYGTWLKGKLLIEHSQYVMAQSTLAQASNLMATADMLALQSEVNKSLADIAAYNKDFKQIKEYLYQSASQARLAKRPVQEIRAYTLLSIMASKLHLNQQKYDYLYKAKTLLGDYRLDGSHYMLIFYHFALFAENDEEREKFYLKILNEPVSPNNRWVFYNAVEYLSNIYLKQGKWQQALDLANSFTEVARSAALKAELYRAQNELIKAREYAKTAFNSARAQRINWLSREMALMLLELNVEDSDTADSLLYKRYLINSGPEWWFKRHKARLIKVGITIDPYNEKEHGT